MSDVSFSSSTDTFWARVRVALDGLRPMGNAPAYGRAEIDRTEGTAPEALVLEEQLRRGWGLAVAHEAPLSVLLVQLDRFADYLTAYGSADAESCMQTLAQIITEALEGAGEFCVPYGRNGYAVILPGLPKGEARAVALQVSAGLREQNMPHKESHAGVVTACMGLATTVPVGSFDESFAAHAAQTLRRAQRRGMGRMMAIDLKPEIEQQAA